MEKDKIYILNPAYYLHYDEKRAVIGAYEEIASDCPHVDSVINIHPLVAQMLTFFDGKRTLARAVEDISEYFGLSQADVYEVIGKYVENIVGAGDEKSNTNIPIYTLVGKDPYERREYYSVEDFPFTGEVDMSYGRLYRPLSCLLELTMKCYTDCIYCYADRRNPCGKREFDPELAKKIFRQARESGIIEVGLNGGEVLSHPYIKDILAEMRKYGYNSLISAKMPIPKGMLEFLRDIGCTYVQISLDSVNPDTLTKILGCTGDYAEKIFATMENLDTMGFDWQINTIITKYNCNAQDETIPLIKHCGNYKSLKKLTVSPAGYSLYKSEKHYRSIKATLDDYNLLKSEVEKTAASYPHIAISARDADLYPYTEKEKTEKFSGRAVCSGNQKSFVVLPDGKVTVCEELYWHPQFIIGDLNSQSILEMWNSDRAKNLFRLPQEEIREGSACKSCPDYNGCRKFVGICWKNVVGAYGMDKWDYPDPDCPKSAPPAYRIYMNS